MRFDRSGVSVDVFDLPALVTADVERASLEALERAAALFRGELLEGCDLPDFFDFTAWLAAERDRARKAQAKVLSELTRRLSDPERALPYARARVKVDPLDEAAGVALVRLLVRSGRKPEAEEHCESVARLLDRTGLARAPLWPALRAELSTPRELAAPSPPFAAAPGTSPKVAPIRRATPRRRALAHRSTARARRAPEGARAGRRGATPGARARHGRAGDRQVTAPRRGSGSFPA